jgi:hypothetical protein
VLAQCAVLIRIRSSHLILRYRWFGAYMIAGLIQNAAWLMGPPSDPRYGSWYVHTAPLRIATSLGAGVELWEMTMSRYSGVRRVYSWLVPGVIGLSITGTIATGFDFWDVGWRQTIYRLVVLAYRYTETPLAIGCALALAWVLVFPDQAPRNVKIHAWVVTLMLTLISASQAAILLANGRSRIASLVSTYGVAILLVLWAALISREGEVTTPPSAPSDDEMARVRALDRDLLNVRRYLRFRL